MLTSPGYYRPLPHLWLKELPFVIPQERYLLLMLEWSIYFLAVELYCNMARIQHEDECLACVQILFNKNYGIWWMLNQWNTGNALVQQMDLVECHILYLIYKNYALMDATHKSECLSHIAIQGVRSVVELVLAVVINVFVPNPMFYVHQSVGRQPFFEMDKMKKKLREPEFGSEQTSSDLPTHIYTVQLLVDTQFKYQLGLAKSLSDSKSTLLLSRLQLKGDIANSFAKAYTLQWTPHVQSILIYLACP
ncbi:hypothetical protein ARMSODRAFT_970061 [Armillaria solidipes]|uniref:Uncharacterized protein n=1 Tax=Armillaria solidipes TaxID=1076256 RepID=A0A2H3CAN9_9AGAR|nr:hypothetical protein ARMSODRAFT_970061 [Armillaria solidipes]